MFSTHISECANSCKRKWFVFHDWQHAFQVKFYRTLHKTHKWLHFSYLFTELAENHEFKVFTVVALIAIQTISTTLGEEL